MENQQMPVEPLQASPTDELPKWVKILFRFYAIIFVLYTLLAGIYVVYGLTALFSFTDFSSTPLKIGVIIFFVLGLIFLIFQILYGFGVYTFKRWVLPIALTFSFSTLLSGLLTLINNDYEGVAYLIGLLIGMTLMGILGYTSLKYWHYFEGSARKLIVQIPLLIVLIPVLVFTTLSQVFTDDPFINDSDIVLQPVELLPESDNAHYSIPNIENLSASERQTFDVALAYTKAFNEVNSSSTEAINFVNATKNLTDSYIAASTKIDYQCPTTVNNYTINAQTCNLNGIRDLALLTAFRARVEADTGNLEQAISTAVSVVKLGSLIGNTDHPLLLEYLVGIAVMNIGLESLERHLGESASTSNEASLAVLSELNESRINDTAYAQSLRREYMSHKDSTKSFAAFGSYFYQHNKTVNQQAEFFRKSAAVSSLGCSADKSQEQQEIERLVQEITESPSKLPIISPNFIGKTLNSVIFASLNIIDLKGCDVNEYNERIQKLLKGRIIQEPEASRAQSNSLDGNL